VVANEKGLIIVKFLSKKVSLIAPDTQKSLFFALYHLWATSYSSVILRRSRCLANRV